MTISSAVEASARARVVGIQTTFKDLRQGQVAGLPQRIALIGQGNTASTYATTKKQVTSALEVAQTYGFGSPLHLAALQLLPTNGDGIGSIPLTVYPLVDDGSGVAAAGDITPSGAVTKAGAYKVEINNIESEEFAVAVGDTVATIITKMTTAINAVLEMPMTAVDNTTVLDVTAKWKGITGNDLSIAVSGPTDTGVSFAITQPTGGLVNPDIQTALDQVGDVWETMILNCLGVSDSTALDAISTFGEGRWGALVRKPLVSFVGNTETTVSNATSVSDGRKTDRVNAQLVAPGSLDLPLVVAARQLARIAVVANSNPARDYGSQDASGLTAGNDGDQWSFVDRDSALKKGSSSIIVKDGVVNIADVVTFYHPSGDQNPAYRYVCDVVKLQNIIYNLDLIFNTPEWDGAPLIPDDQPTTNRSAKKPKTAKAAVAALVDNLGLEAIISDPETAKASIQAGINGSNPKRLDVALTVQLSGNANIISVDLDFGFYFGVAPIVA